MKSLIAILIAIVLAACNNDGGGIVRRDTIRIPPDTVPLMDVYKQAWWDGFNHAFLADTLFWWDSTTQRLWQTDSQSYAIQYRDTYIQPERIEEPFNYPVYDSTWWDDSASHYFPIDTIDWITPDSFVLRPAWNKRE